MIGFAGGGIPALRALTMSGALLTPEDQRALTRQFVLVREADRMGYDDIWIGEQHADGHWPTPSITARRRG